MRRANTTLRHLAILAAAGLAACNSPDEPDYIDEGVIEGEDVGYEQDVQENAGVARPEVDEIEPDPIGTHWEIGTSWDDADYDAWDVNDDQRLDADEWRAGLGNTGVYTDWDANRDARLTDDEFGEGLFGEWDLDDDSRLTEDEYVRGTRTWYAEPMQYGAFGDWDVNDDDYLEADEWQGRYNQVGLFDTWDANDDGFLDTNEYSTGLYDTWDVNDDTFLDTNEVRW